MRREAAALEGKTVIRDLQYPADARMATDSFHTGLQYDAAVARLGNICAHRASEVPAPSVGIKFGDLDGAVLRDARGLLSRFSLISMVSRIEGLAQSLLLQRRVIEELGATGRMQPAVMWRILRQVHKEARGGPVKLCSVLVVTQPSDRLLERMAWLGGIVKVRNCLAHRLGQVALEDVTPSGVALEQTQDTDALKVAWLEFKVSVAGTEITSFPHHGGGQVECKFVEYQREWKIGDQIEVSPQECQAIGWSLSLLGNQLLAEFESEMNVRLASGPGRLTP
jgi:hypothetical protein